MQNAECKMQNCGVRFADGLESVGEAGFAMINCPLTVGRWLLPPAEGGADISKSDAKTWCGSGGSKPHPRGKCRMQNAKCKIAVSALRTD